MMSKRNLTQHCGAVYIPVYYCADIQLITSYLCIYQNKFSRILTVEKG